jgi:small subunit ribosomal protein S17
VSERKGQAGGAKGGQAKAGAKKAAAPKAEAVKAAAPKAEAPKPVAPSARKAEAKAADAAAAAEGRAHRAFKRTLIGRVKSDKMDKTVVVEVVRSKMDPVYKKYVRVRKSYKAHDEENTYRVGDRVEIIEHRPLSKLKRWKVINLVERAVQE